MKKLAIILIFVMLSGQALAAITAFSDDFNRADNTGSPANWSNGWGTASGTNGAGYYTLGGIYGNAGYGGTSNDTNRGAVYHSLGIVDAGDVGANVIASVDQKLGYVNLSNAGTATQHGNYLKLTLITPGTQDTFDPMVGESAGAEAIYLLSAGTTVFTNISTSFTIAAGDVGKELMVVLGWAINGIATGYVSQGYFDDLAVVGGPGVETVVYYVNNQHPSASDGNPGTIGLPVATIGKGIDLALAQKAMSINSRVVIYPGTYKEEIFRDMDLLYGGDTYASLEIEADQPGTVVLTGADVWDTGWSQVGSTDKYTHDWPYDWGPGPVSGSGGPPQSEIMLRKELVLVDEKIYMQVLDIGNLGEEMFHVDEALDILTIYLPGGIGIGDVTVEVAVRGGRVPDNLFRMDNFNNLTIRGLTVEKSRGSFYNDALCVASCSNVLIEDCVVSKNNFHGFCIFTSDTVTVRRVVANNNGYSNRFGHSDNLVIEDSEFNNNNWRGALAGYYSWDTAGIKTMHSNFVTFRRCDFIGNESGGLWFDTDITDVLIEDCKFNDNYLQGLALERVAGPVNIDNCWFINNDWSGVEIHTTKNGTITNSLFMCDVAEIRYGRFGSLLRVGGSNLSDGIYTQDWTWQNNMFVSYDLDSFLMEVDTNDYTGYEWEPATLTNFKNTLISNGNSGYHSQASTAFEYDDTAMTLSGWQSATNQDLDFFFDATAVPPRFCGDFGTVYLPGDTDRNCHVNLFDFSIISRFWLEQNCSIVNNCEGADISLNNAIGIEDVISFVHDWLLQ